MLRKLIAEWIGRFSLLATVVGSGIMAERLADGNVAGLVAVQLVAAVLVTLFFGWFLGEQEIRS